MAQLFQMPQLGSTMEEGTVLKWHKQEGDAIRLGELLLEIETDKASMEVESPADGVVRRILAAEGDIIPIRQPIAIIGHASESIDALLKSYGKTGESVIEAQPPVLDATTSSETAASATAQLGPAGGSEVFLSPRARALADSKGIAYSHFAAGGTGPGGRVIERDVLAALAAGSAFIDPALPDSDSRTAPRATPLAARIADHLGIDLNDLATGLPGSRVRREDVLRHQAPVTVDAASTAFVATSDEDYKSVPFTGMRKRIADNVVKSAFTAPHVTLTLEVDMTVCSEFRDAIIPDLEKASGVRLSFTDILIKAVAKALGEFPILNASLVDNEVRRYSNKNIGVAVALDEGLIVPVVKNADQKSLGAVSAELKQLVERSRAGKFTPDDLAGGTFTITNLGAFGIDVFDPIIVTGQAAILGVGRIADKAIVVSKQIVVRSMMNLCLSFDHRILDGAPAARFLQRVKVLLEHPVLIVV